MDFHPDFTIFMAGRPYRENNGLGTLGSYQRDDDGGKNVQMLQREIV